MNALGHHVAAAAFAAPEPLDEVGDGGARPYAKAYEVAFGDDGLMPARKAANGNAMRWTRGHLYSVLDPI